jgi:hypothetical protein
MPRFRRSSFAILLFCWSFQFLSGQQPAAAPSPSPGAAAAVTPAATWLPKFIFTGGGGFTSPNGKFAYYSESTYVGSGTYSTFAQEYTIINGQVQSATLAGVTKPLYQFGQITVGLTGLGGGSVSTSGSTAAVASGQVFVDIRIKKTAWGATLTGTKNSTGGWKFTLAPRWAQ